MICSTCGKTEESLGCSHNKCEHNRCRDCRHNFVEVVGDLCENCVAFGAKRSESLKNIPSPGAVLRLAENYCKVCQEKKFLGELGICEGCMNTYYDMEHCAECEGKYSPTDAFQALCSKCKPNCTSCGKPFNPLDRTDVTCAECRFKIARQQGTCSVCKEVDVPLDNRGTCVDCEPIKIPTIYCSACKRNTTTGGKRVCDSCEQQHIEVICLGCGNNFIDATSYLCDSCFENRYGKYER